MKPGPLPSVTLAALLQRVRVASFQHCCDAIARVTYPPFSSGSAGQRHAIRSRAMKKVEAGLRHAAETYGLKVVQVNPDRARADSPRPVGRHVQAGDLSAVCREITLAWNCRPELKAIDARTLKQNAASIDEAIGSTRSEALSAELILTSRYLELEPVDQATWTSCSTLREGDRYLASARYREASGTGEPVLLCVPIPRFWLTSSADIEGDEIALATALQAFRDALRREAGRLEIWGPVRARIHRRIA